MKRAIRTPSALLAMIAIAIVALTWWKARESVDGAIKGRATPQAEHARPTVPANRSIDSRPQSGSSAGLRNDANSLDSRRSAREEATRKIAKAGRDRLEGRYASERGDPRWAMATERTLSGLQTSPQIEDLGAKPIHFNANCRTSVCRIHADFASRRAAEDWLTLYTLNAAVQMPNVSVQTLANPDGSIRLELYGFARP
jgi:hypothetical protein